METFEGRPGFQGSKTTGVEVSIHGVGKDPIFLELEGETVLSGRYNDGTSQPSVVGVSTGKQLGASAGTCNVELKVPRLWERRNARLDEVILDDSWIDVTFKDHGKRVHYFRGVVDATREVERAGTSGTNRTYSITSRDFGSIYERTPIWYNVFRAENAGNALTIPIFKSQNIGGSPDVVVKAFLQGFLEAMGSKKRANWILPKSLGVDGTTLLDAVEIDDIFFTNDPKRIAVNPQFMQVQGSSLWQLAQEWSDPVFCELFSDIRPEGIGRDFDFGSEYLPSDTAMRVTFRDRPFPTRSEGRASRWFALPTLQILPQHIESRDIGRGGQERFNSYKISPQVLKEYTGGQDIIAPLWDPEDMELHGMRIFSVESRYVATYADRFTMVEKQREKCRDWHCLNPYLYNGTLGLAFIAPHLHVGHRLQIAADDDDKVMTFYVEGVAHKWTPLGGKTTASVTRGWRGSDGEYLAALDTVAKRYILYSPDQPNAGADFGDDVLT